MATHPGVRFCRLASRTSQDAAGAAGAKLARGQRIINARLTAARDSDQPEDIVSLLSALTT